MHVNKQTSWIVDWKQKQSNMLIRILSLLETVDMDYTEMSWCSRSGLDCKYFFFLMQLAICRELYEPEEQLTLVN